MLLNRQQRQFLRGLAQHKKPVVIVGAAGLTSAVVGELDTALEHHELLKVKLPPLERAARRRLADTICKATHATLVQFIGRVAVIYRAAREPKLPLPH